MYFRETGTHQDGWQKITSQWGLSDRVTEWLTDMIKAWDAIASKKFPLGTIWMPRDVPRANLPDLPSAFPHRCLMEAGLLPTWWLDVLPAPSPPWCLVPCWPPVWGPHHRATNMKSLMNHLKEAHTMQWQQCSYICSTLGKLDEHIAPKHTSTS